MIINFNFNTGVDSPINHQPKSSYYNTQQSSSEAEEQRFKQASAEKRAILAEMRLRDLEAAMKEMIRSKR